MRTNQDQSNYMFLDLCVSAAQSIYRSVIKLRIREVFVYYVQKTKLKMAQPPDAICALNRLGIL